MNMTTFTQHLKRPCQQKILERFIGKVEHGRGNLLSCCLFSWQKRHGRVRNPLGGFVACAANTAHTVRNYKQMIFSSFLFPYFVQIFSNSECARTNHFFTVSIVAFPSENTQAYGQLFGRGTLRATFWGDKPFAQEFSWVAQIFTRN